MSYLLILLLILLYTMQSFFCKVYTDNYPGAPTATTPVFSVVSGLTTALVTLIFALFSLPFHFCWQVALLGIINGVVAAAYNASMIKASQRGPYSIQMVFMLSGGILLPAFVAFIYGDRLSLGQWISVAVIVVSIFLVSKKKGEKLGSGDLLFWVFCISLFIFNGAYGVLFDIQQNRWAATAESKNEMIMFTFATSAFINAIMGFVQRKKQFVTDFKQTRKSGIFLVLCSIATALAINLLVFIMPLIDITVLYTFDNAGVLLFSVLCSFVFLKEKLWVTNIIGCVLMGAGLVGMVVL
ncbi:MAG: hypothetical protein IJX39_05110 [Clostridia bacterium]|nr:hypothetical protein [Clostridia bacterium]